ncbi:MAG: hypothetical protein LUE12_01090 [Ruminococcus sp.]|nr:hypothetical protein [Ruminococcus sp.]
MNFDNETKNFLTFKAAGVRFACSFESVIRIEAAKAAEITPAPAFPDYCFLKATLCQSLTPQSVSV